MATISQIFAAQGVPESVWRPIMLLESGGDAGAYVKSGVEESVGLFQLNRMGGLGTGYTVGQLKDPVFNATIAAAKMGPSYARGLDKGLDGFALTQYVAYSSGWPTQAGTRALQYDKTVQSYDPKLLSRYNEVTGRSGIAGTASVGGGIQSGGTLSMPAVGISNQLQALQGTATATGGGWASEAGSLGLMIIIAVLGLVLLFAGLKLVSGGSSTTVIKEVAEDVS